MGQPSSGRRRSIARRGLQPRAQSPAVVLVVVDELGYAGAAVLVGQVELSASVLFYVVVLCLRMVSARKIIFMYYKL